MGCVGSANNMKWVGLGWVDKNGPMSMSALGYRVAWVGVFAMAILGMERHFRDITSRLFQTELEICLRHESHSTAIFIAVTMEATDLLLDSTARLRFSR